MTDKITLASIASFQNDATAVTQYNANNALITTALNNTLSRDGTSPNQLGATLDANSNQIINLPAPTSNQSPIRQADFVSGSSLVYTGGTNITVGGTTISTVTNPVFTSITSPTAVHVTSVTTPALINTGTLTLPTTTDTLVGAATTNTLTNKTFDTAGTGNSFKISGNSITGIIGTASTNLPFYSSGAWTPADGSGASLSFTVTDANYYLVGKVCFITAAITWPSTASGANAQINGLPFTSANFTARCNCGPCIGVSNGNILVSTNATNFQIFTDTFSNITNATLSTVALRVAFFYITG